jgi:hypothetical protein
VRTACLRVSKPISLRLTCLDTFLCVRRLPVCVCVRAACLCVCVRAACPCVCVRAACLCVCVCVIVCAPVETKTEISAT